MSPAKKKRLTRHLLGVTLLGLGVVAGLAGVTLLAALRQVDVSMSGRVWDVPSRLYPSTVSLRVGGRVPPGPLDKTLEGMGYHRVGSVASPGDFKALGEGRFQVRAFPSWPGGRASPTQTVQLTVQAGEVKDLKHAGKPVKEALLPPASFAEMRQADQALRQPVPFKSFPKVLINAVVAVEDKRFFQHFGVDVRGIARAVVANLRHGGAAQGASTITQQLARSYFLSPEKTLSRKLKEAFYALALEMQLPKERILELYLNEIYLGQRGAVSISGMGEAAHAYFSKRVQDLSLDEAALLAGIIQAPNGYAPDRHPDKALARRNVVLGRMLEQGFITQAEHDKAAGRAITLKPGSSGQRTAPYYVDHVSEQVSAVFPEAEFSVDGYSIETTLDVRIQRAAEKALEDGLKKLDGQSRAPLEGAVVVLQPATGRVLAMVGGRSYATSQFNRVTRAERQPGSVLKPLVVMAALEHKGKELGPSTVLLDEPITVESHGKAWKPVNNDHTFHGQVTLREVLEQSINVPTVKLAQDVGVQRVVDLLHKLGVEREIKPLPSLALGALDVTPLEVATAFTAVATDGAIRIPYAVDRVLSREGKVLLEGSSEIRPVVNPTHAFLVRDMMRGVLDRGTGRNARTLGYTFEASGKTGTTSDNHDAWFVGFDRELLVVVWVGSDEPQSTGLTGSRAAMPIWATLMKSIRADVPPPADPLPDELVRVDVCTESLHRATTRCPEHAQELFWRGRDPVDFCPTHADAAQHVESQLRRLPRALGSFLKGIFD
ncbi:MAG: PBP1A family penicillin-binding protein [Myxococcota bacterium]